MTRFDIEQELARGDEELERIKSTIATLSDQNVSKTKREMLDLRYGIVDEAGLQIAIAREIERSVETDLAVIQLAFDHEIDENELGLLYDQFTDLTDRPGDLIARQPNNGFALLLPWTDEHCAQQLCNVVVGMASYAAPDAELHVGYQIITGGQVTAQRPLGEAPNRMRYQARAATIGRPR